MDRVLRRGDATDTFRVLWATGEETEEPHSGLRDTAALHTFLTAEADAPGQERAARVTAAEDEQQLQQWIGSQRNTNTRRSYDAAMRQFVAWARGEGSSGLLVPISEDRPSQANVAAYMRYMVIERRRPMSTVGIHLSAIADHVRFAVGENGYQSPTQGQLIRAMRAVLIDRATKAGGKQKQAMDWELLQRTVLTINRVIEPSACPGSPDSVRWMARRDQAMILIGFFFLLRRSEVARMKRKDVDVKLMRVASKQVKVLQIYVNEQSKNDRERRGHVRIAAGRPGQDICVLRSTARYILECEQGEPRRIATPEDPLFPRLEGGPMAADTPHGRLKHWLKAAGVEDTEQYGFHSLRAGAATDAHKNGATEEWIKQHGNWKSDAVKTYIRQGIEERLATTAALGQGGSRAAEVARGSL